MKSINSNSIFYCIAFFGLFAFLAGVNIVIKHALLGMINPLSVVMIILTMISSTLIPLMLLSLARLYLNNDLLVVKKGVRVLAQIPLRDIRVLKRVSAFPYGFNYSKMVRKYRIDFIDIDAKWDKILFFDTLSDQKNILDFVEKIKEKNPFVKLYI